MYARRRESKDKTKEKKEKNVDVIARIAEKEDISAITSFWKRLVTEETEAVDDVKDFDSALEKWSWRLNKMIDTKQAFVVEYNNGIVGFICYLKQTKTETRTQDAESYSRRKIAIPSGVAFVTDIYVSPEARKSNAAMSLFQILEKSAIKSGCNAIWTNTNIRNRRIHILLKRLGFSVMEDFTIAEKEKDIYFKKELIQKTDEN